MIPHWSQAYVGLPSEDFGPRPCWGLTTRVFYQQWGIVLPEFTADVSPAEREHIAAAFDRGRDAGPWREVPAGEARPFDVLVFRRGGLDAHVGIVAVPRRMLHVTSGLDCLIADYTTGCWAPRLSAVYRHPWVPEVSDAG